MTAISLKADATAVAVDGAQSALMLILTVLSQVGEKKQARSKIRGQEVYGRHNDGSSPKRRGRSSKLIASANKPKSSSSTNHDPHHRHSHHYSHLATPDEFQLSATATLSYSSTSLSSNTGNIASSSSLLTRKPQVFVSKTTWLRRNTTLVENKNLDSFCWLCHKSGELTVCSECPRVYHIRCLQLDQPPPDHWLCPECAEIASCESIFGVTEKWRTLNQEQVRACLVFLLDHLSRHSWAAAFREPVDTKLIPEYGKLIKHPMDLRTLLQRVNGGQYASTHSFLADFRWIVHNCLVFNSQTNVNLVVKVRLLERLCLREICLLRACPQCYLNRIPALSALPSTPEVFPELSKSDPGTLPRYLPKSSLIEDALDPEIANGRWFTKLCPVVHPLVWIRLDKFPCWPAKVLEIGANSLLVIFFGDYVSTSAPLHSAIFHSKESLDKIALEDGLTNLVSEVSSATSVGLTPAKDTAMSGSFSYPSAAYRSPSSARSSQSKRPRQSSSSSQQDARTSSADFKKAVRELEAHVALIYEEYVDFYLPPPNLPFSKRDAEKYYGPFNRYLISQSKQSLSQEGADPSTINTSGVADTLFSDAATITAAAALVSYTGDHPSVSTPVSNEKTTTVTVASSTAAPSSTNASAALPPWLAPLSTEPVLLRLAALRCNGERSLSGSPSLGQPSPSPNLSEVAVPTPRVAMAEDDSRPPVSPTNEASIAHTTEAPPAKRIRCRSSGDFDEAGDPERTEDTLGPPNKVQEMLESLPTQVISQLAEAKSKLTDSIDLMLSSMKLQLQETVAPFLNPTSNVATQTLDPPAPRTDDASDAVEEVKDLSGADSPSRFPEEKSHKNPHENRSIKKPVIQHDKASLTAACVDFDALRELLLRAEIEHQDRELQRMRILLDYTRAEMATEMRHRIAELRRVWESELAAIIEAAGKVWEQEALAIADSIKRKQWCAYCGNEAFFYCCWNTCYCNTNCQQMHWPTHMVTCAQTKVTAPQPTEVPLQRATPTCTVLCNTTSNSRPPLLANRSQQPQQSQPLPTPSQVLAAQPVSISPAVVTITSSASALGLKASNLAPLNPFVSQQQHLQQHSQTTLIQSNSSLTKPPSTQPSHSLPPPPPPPAPETMSFILSPEVSLSQKLSNNSTAVCSNSGLISFLSPALPSAPIALAPRAGQPSQRVVFSPTSSTTRPS
uniref:Protein kinase C-binding protein 1 n=1 Tax=Schistocephalus solidus TaxID=70667 RepID=A0A0X3Q094_SCHSO